MAPHADPYFLQQVDRTFIISRAAQEKGVQRTGVRCVEGIKELRS
jgi:hypothetical protein